MHVLNNTQDVLLTSRNTQRRKRKLSVLPSGGLQSNEDIRMQKCEVYVTVG